GLRIGRNVIALRDGRHRYGSVTGQHAVELDRAFGQVVVAIAVVADDEGPIDGDTGVSKRRAFRIDDRDDNGTGLPDVLERQRRQALSRHVDGLGSRDLIAIRRRDLGHGMLAKAEAIDRHDVRRAIVADGFALVDGIADADQRIAGRGDRRDLDGTGLRGNLEGQVGGAIGGNVDRLRLGRRVSDGRGRHGDVVRARSDTFEGDDAIGILVADRLALIEGEAGVRQGRAARVHRGHGEAGCRDIDGDTDRRGRRRGDLCLDRRVDGIIARRCLVDGAGVGAFGHVRHADHAGLGRGIAFSVVAEPADDAVDGDTTALFGDRLAGLRLETDLDRSRLRRSRWLGRRFFSRFRGRERQRNLRLAALLDGDRKRLAADQVGRTLDNVERIGAGQDTIHADDTGGLVIITFAVVTGARRADHLDATGRVQLDTDRASRLVDAGQVDDDTAGSRLEAGRRHQVLLSRLFCRLLGRLGGRGGDEDAVLAVRRNGDFLLL